MDSQEIAQAKEYAVKKGKTVDMVNVCLAFCRFHLAGGIGFLNNSSLPINECLHPFRKK
jgi:hypothetical protein